MDPEAGRTGGRSGHLVPPQPEADGVGLDPCHCSDRNGGLAPAPEAAALEDELSDAIVGADDEPGHVPEPMIVGGEDLACSAELDLPFGNAVVGQCEQIPATAAAAALAGARRGCDHVWLPGAVVSGWVIEECPKCGGRRVAP